MSSIRKPDPCPCCGPSSASRETRIEIVREVPRRDFLRTLGGAAAAAAGLTAVPGLGRAATLGLEAKESKTAENFVKVLYESLSDEQRQKICFPFDHEKASEVQNNWHIVPQRIGEFFNADQQAVIREILKGITSEDGFDRFQKSMKEDDGGLERYSCAIFGDPSTKKFQWVLTGRHVTLRADGNSVENQALGGPIFYGHASGGFNEKPDHPGNVWWHQGKLANQLFEALDGSQQKKALLPKSPPDNADTIQVKGNAGEIPGLSASELSKDQKELLEGTFKSLLAMFRESDVDEAVECVKKNGGLDKAHISYFKESDIGDDGVWDRWRVEGPTFVWYFRGSPHVHTWVNIQHTGPTVF